MRLRWVAGCGSRSAIESIRVRKPGKDRTMTSERKFT
jgi:hypothetical protein